jgi:hypothetical protein
MLRPSGSTRPALRSALAVSVGLGIGLAAQVSPGDVVDVASRPTGLRYEVTLRHQDGTYTVVEVDAPTGRVVRAELADHWNGS